MDCADRSPRLPEAARCTGCGACVAACPHDALREATDAAGFPYPALDASRCRDCAACQTVCPVLHTAAPEAPATEEAPQASAYVGACRSNAVLFGSAAGGLFSALALRTLRKGGAVLGAAFDGDFTLAETLAETHEAMTTLRGLKYPQALANGCFRAVRERLEAGRPVFACLPPCRAEALVRFLGGRPEGLLLAETACSGVCSPEAFRAHLKALPTRETGKLLSFRATLRELLRPAAACDRTFAPYAWHDSAVTFAQGQGRFRQASEEPFVRLALGTDALLRPSCRDCPWVKGDRSAADLTLSRATAERQATGCAMPRTAKGRAALEGLSGVTLEAVPAPLSQPPPPRVTPPSAACVAFWETLRKGSFAEAARHLEGFLPHLTPPDTLKRRLRLLLRYAPPWRLARFLLACRLNGLRTLLCPEGTCGVLLPAGSHAVIRCKNPKGLCVERGVFVFGHDHVRDDGLSSRIAVDRHSSIRIHGHGRVKSGSEFIVYAGGRLEIGVGLDAESHLEIRCASRTILGNYVGIGRHVTILDNSGGHPTSNLLSDAPRVTEIGDHAWLCDGCTIMPGVRVGAGAIVSAGAIVTHSVPAYAVVAGNPATVVGKNILWGG